MASTLCGSRNRSVGICIIVRIFCLGVGLAAFLLPLNSMHAQVADALESYRLPVIKIRGRALGDPGAFVKPIGIRLVGDQLVVLDRSADNQVAIVSAQTGRLERTFGRQGAGPGEFLGAQSIEIDAVDPRVVWVYDMNQRRFTRIEGLLRGGPPGRPTFTTLSLGAGVTIWNPLWTYSGEIVATGFFPDNRVGLFDRTGKPLHTFLPVPGQSTVPVSVRQEAYRSSLVLSPDRRRLAVATRHADRIDFHLVTGAKLGQGERPFSFEPRYELAQGAAGPAMSTGSDLRFGYIALASTDRHVYALFSGRVRKGSGGLASFGSYLHVYNWRGRLERVFHLDAALLALTVSGDGTRVFGVRHDPLPNVMVFDIPSASTPRGK